MMSSVGRARALKLCLSLLAASISGLVACLVACGVTQVELAPSAPDELVVLGKVPGGVLERFAREQSGTLDAARLSLRYPAEGTRLPENLPAMRFVWDSAQAPKPMPMKPKPDKPQAPGPMYFELCLDAAEHRLCLYTDRHELDVTGDHWRSLLAADVGADVVVRLRGVQDTEQPMFAVAPRTMSVLAPIASGSIYYKSLAHASLERVEIDSLQRDAATLPAPWPSSTAALSRDGKRLAWTPSDHEIQLLSLPELTVLWTVEAPFAGPVSAGLSFDPTARRIAFARAGQLALLDADSGAVLTHTDPQAALTLGVSHPDWSPDGRFLAVTLWPMDAVLDELALEGTSLGRIAVALDGSLAAPEVLLASSKRDETLAFPSYARDGNWLAYVQLKGKLRDAREPALWLMPSAPGRAPLRLQRALADKPKDDTTASLTAPTWLPGAEAGVDWLLFASGRAAGFEAQAMGQQQLWITPVDKALAQQALDPSGPALWLPFQAADAHNTNPLFAREAGD